jgi:outer membrane lipoprotein-sorting protein
MEHAYSRVTDYRTNTEIHTYKPDGTSRIKRFTYTFKKPKMIRLDLEAPHSGMILVYPDKDGKVEVQPSGILSFFKLHLTPGDPRLQSDVEQRIDQTDFGLLIKNISRSLGPDRRSPVEISESDEAINVGVTALDHFRADTLTHYDFVINKTMCLPAKLTESTVAGQVERTISFENIEINIGVADNVFRLD